jgi:hypothetical protein
MLTEVTNQKSINGTEAEWKMNLEPTSGLEPLTCRLRIGCSTN